jgi:hypothetical protein
MPHVRITFEQDGPARCEDPAAFKNFVAPILRNLVDLAGPEATECSVEWGGYVSADAARTKQGRLEPLWQFLLFGTTKQIDQAFAFLRERNGESIVSGYVAAISRGDWPAES